MRKMVNILPWLLLIVLMYFLLVNKLSVNTDTESKHQLMVDKIEAIGKLELVKYKISDVVEHIERTDFLPEASVLLIIKAEVVGCIDLKTITKDDIKLNGDTVYFTLPKAEICYVKIDHKNSKVYDTKMAYFREAQLVDGAYKAAEAKILSDVEKSKILEETKTNAVNVLKPIFEGLGNKHVIFSFK